MDTPWKCRIEASPEKKLREVKQFRKLGKGEKWGEQPWREERERYPS
jgi:hypothetical protein